MRPHFGWQALDITAFSACSAIYICWAELLFRVQKFSVPLVTIGPSRDDQPR
jgi:hypothetical protein